MPPDRPSFSRAAWSAFALPVTAAVLSALLAWGVASIEVPARFAELHTLAIRVAQTLVWLSVMTVSIRFGRFVLFERVILRIAAIRAPKLLDQAGATFAYVFYGGLMLNYTWDVSPGGLFATSGVLGLVLGFALRPVLTDYLSGIALNLEAPFRLNDFVIMRVRGQSVPIVGLVREVSWRSTTIMTPERKLVLVPNSLVAEASIENGSAPSSITEFDLEVVLDWAVPAETLETILVAATTEAWMRGATAGEQPPTARIRRLEGDGVVYKLTYKVDPLTISKGRARHQLLRAVHEHLRAAGLRPVNEHGPTPQRAIRYDEPADRVALLEEVPLLASLTPRERAALAEAIVVRRHRAKDVVVRRGEQGSSLFIVAAGVLEVTADGAGSDRPTRLATLAPGDLFGEMSALTGAARTADVATVVPSVLYEIGHEAFTKLLADRPQLADDLASIVAKRRRDPAETAADTSRADSDAKTATLKATIARAMHEFFRA